MQPPQAHRHLFLSFLSFLISTSHSFSKGILDSFGDRLPVQGRNLGWKSNKMRAEPVVRTPPCKKTKADVCICIQSDFSAANKFCYHGDKQAITDCSWDKTVDLSSLRKRLMNREWQESFPATVMSSCSILRQAVSPECCIMLIASFLWCCKAEFL